MGTGASSASNFKAGVTPGKISQRSTLRNQENIVYANISPESNLVRMDPRPNNAAFLCGDVNGWNHVVWKGSHETSRRASFSEDMPTYDGSTSFVNQIVGFGHSCELSNCSRNLKDGEYRCKLKDTLRRSRQSSVDTISDVGHDMKTSFERKSLGRPFTYRTFSEKSWRRQCMDPGTVAARINRKLLTTARDLKTAKYRQTEIYL
ncbi:uncharacterized protein LOC106867539 [Octopus bimaculoides]|uniref:Uncharacterized protein n=1 Tax=Octopus bimaculoides TaxID=37653 RepID=A0A0L8I052_OCTBM|nr:uncharacterized protein LOC106867539 [Octopus bimaculoides]|eukprot:XP_014767923.1 PREDICTED: uncharacterized protein LOC106867539 [Octopus bimaculoides]